jgi:3-phenylpropionate/trans-cinnamate dioxygenase ferredoxin subunit
MPKYVVAPASEIPEGSRIIVRLGDREVGVFNVGGRFYALLNRCPHLGGPLCTGPIVNRVYSSGPGDFRLDTSRQLITCPWHNWEFDVATGQSYVNPERMRARRYEARVEGGEALLEQIREGSAEPVEGPYQAETVPVSVEDDYIVVSLRGRP